MAPSVLPSPSSRLRVLVVDEGRPVNRALAEWLRIQPELMVRGPAATVPAALAFTNTFHPDVVLLDFHGLSVPIWIAVKLFKTLSPAPRVFVLTHDMNDVMHRRLLEARVDAVFDKTSDLDALATLLTSIRTKPASQPCEPPRPVPAARASSF